MSARTLTLFLLALLTGAVAFGQRGGRDDGSRRRPNARGGGGELAQLKFQDRLWFGAGGSLGFRGGNDQSFAQIGITPQVGYKFNNWLSAGPRFGVDLFLIKGFAAREGVGVGEPRRYTLVDLTLGGFVRGRYRQFYVQTELNALSRELPAENSSGSALVDDRSNDVVTDREGDVQLQVGVGYAPPGNGGLGTDIGIFYNLFDDVESFNISPIEFRFNLTFRY